MDSVRYESCVTSISWIPSEAVIGVSKAVFGSGFTHYDDPPPDAIKDLDAMAAADRFRFANRLSAWVEVEGGLVVDAGYSGGCVMGATTLGLGARRVTFAALSFPDLRHDVEITGDAARFAQTVGGHTAVPAPRRVGHPPFIAFRAPTVWTTLALTIRADGTSGSEVVGASSFPRHWIYDGQGRLSSKVGLADFKEWWRNSSGTHTPWGKEESPAFVTTVESALEREVATRIMRSGRKPSVRRVKAGHCLTTQGEEGGEVYLLLNGIVDVILDDQPIAEVGPGAILGERAGMEGGRRTSTLRARTQAKVAVIPAKDLDRSKLVTISEGHRREES